MEFSLNGSVGQNSGRYEFYVVCSSTIDVVSNTSTIVAALKLKTKRYKYSGNTTYSLLIDGIGVNVNQGPEDFEEEVRPIASSLAQVLGRPVRRSQLAAEIIRALDRMYARFPQDKQAYLEQYRADCLTPGNQVQLITPSSRQEAFAVGIDDQFRLVVEYPDGRRAALSSGEVSVRGMYGYV